MKFSFANSSILSSCLNPFSFTNARMVIEQINSRVQICNTLTFLLNKIKHGIMMWMLGIPVSYIYIHKHPDFFNIVFTRSLS